MCGLSRIAYLHGHSDLNGYEGGDASECAVAGYCSRGSPIVRVDNVSEGARVYPAEICSASHIVKKIRQNLHGEEAAAK